MTGRRTTPEYWERIWTTNSTRDDLMTPAADSPVATAFTGWFDRFSNRFPQGGRVIEVGCASSVWLPYWSRVHGLSVWGLDYSRVGCERAREVLAATGINGHIVCADLFQPPDELLGQFDVVTSHGVVEHFDETSEALRAVARLAKPDGVVLTTIPNLAGAIGWVQRHLNRPVYDLHVPLDREELAAAHTAAGLEVVDARYLLPSGFGVLNLDGLPRSGPKGVARRAIVAALTRLSRLHCAIERGTGRRWTSRLLSPYAACAATRPS